MQRRSLFKNINFSYAVLLHESSLLQYDCDIQMNRIMWRDWLKVKLDFIFKS